MDDSPQDSTDKSGDAPVAANTTANTEQPKPRPLLPPLPANNEYETRSKKLDFSTKRRGGKE